MKKNYVLLLFALVLFSFSAKAQSGCLTCALEEILKDEWKNPNISGTSGESYFGWTFNVRNKFGISVKADEIEELENAANNSGVESVTLQQIVEETDGYLVYRVVPHLVFLKNGEPYFIYQRYIISLF